MQILTFSGKDNIEKKYTISLSLDITCKQSAPPTIKKNNKTENQKCKLEKRTAIKQVLK